MLEPILIPLDSVSLLTLAAGGRVRVERKGMVFEVLASGDLARLQYKVKTRVNGGVRVQPVQPKKDVE